MKKKEFKHFLSKYNDDIFYMFDQIKGTVQVKLKGV